MFLLLLFAVVFVWVSHVIFRGHNDIKVMMYLFITGFTIYSGIGIALYSIDDEILYFAEFMLFSVSFMAAAWIKRGKRTRVLRGLPFVNEHHLAFLYAMSAVYILTFVYPLILGRITFSDLLNVMSVFTEYRATPFSVRVARRSNLVYTVITNQVRGISMPFFYLLLYRYRKKAKCFIPLFLLPVLLKTVADGYLSRNNIAVYAAFLFIYLVLEGYLNKKIAAAMAIAAIPAALALLNVLAAMRTGVKFSFSFSGIGENIAALVRSECSFPVYYNVCSSMFDLGGTVNFFVYILLAVIPSQFYSLIGLSVPNLAYAFTEAVLGMSYGAQDYYIVLPSVLGEAVILFGKYFAWIYGGIYAVFAMWFLRVLSKDRSLKYLKLYFMLDFFRQFRGGSQYVLSSWLTTLIPFVVIVWFLSKCRITVGGRDLLCGTEDSVQEKAK